MFIRIPDYIRMIWKCNSGPLFETQSHCLRIWIIASLLQWPLTTLAYCLSNYSESRLAHPQAQRRAIQSSVALPALVQGRAKCQTYAASVLNVVNSWLVYSLLEKAPNLVIHWVEVVIVRLMVEMTTLSSTIDRAFATFSNFYVSRGNAAMF